MEIEFEIDGSNSACELASSSSLRVEVDWNLMSNFAVVCLSKMLIFM